MKQLHSIFIGCIALALLACCNNNKPIEQTAEKHTSIYHWKSTFELDSAELAFLQTHNIDRIYVKMYDVATEQNFLSGEADIVPIATTKFVSAIPDNVEIIPVIYITIDALYALGRWDRTEEFGKLIIERTLAMCRYNKCGKIRELQLDCDWTSTTKDVYEKLCGIIRKSLREKDIDLSITVRLHQLRESAPPADRGVLMLYNTGALKDIKTKNSILDMADAKPYLKSTRYPIPLDYAYPAFGWGVKFENDKFVAIVTDEETKTAANEYIRYERATATDILKVKSLVEDKLGKPTSGNILYHLDEVQLKNYTDDEIAQILAY